MVVRFCSASRSSVGVPAPPGSWPSTLSTRPAVDIRPVVAVSDRRRCTREAAVCTGTPVACATAAASICWRVIPSAAAYCALARSWPMASSTRWPRPGPAAPGVPAVVAWVTGPPVVWA
jgi:hypothetical protein